MSGSSARRWVLLGVGLLALGAQGALRAQLQARQERAGLVIAGADTEGMATDVAVPTLALGAFRGLVTDYLWLRSFALREQGRTYEARQNAELICRLQPRLPEVWSYLGSHLAYDLAATEFSWQGRWRWIQNGIKLLRNQGIRFNPDAPTLYFTLSRIYQDKIGTSMDDFHLRFKSQHAHEMRLFLGPRGEHTLQDLAAAPRVEVLLVQDAEVRELVSRAKALLGRDLTLALLEIEAGLRAGKRPGDPAIASFLDTQRQGGAWRRLLRSVRARHLRGNTRIDLVRAQEIERSWGPLDWYGSDAMAVYWAVEGMRVAEEQGDLRQQLRLRRIAVQALKNAMRRGRIHFVPDGSVYFTPILELIPRLDALYLESIAMARERIGQLERRAKRTFERLETEALVGTRRAKKPRDAHGHGPPEKLPVELGTFKAANSYLLNQEGAREDFLGEAILLLSQYGRDRTGRRLLRTARAAYPDNAVFALSYSSFLIGYMIGRYTDAGTYDTQVGMSQLIEGTWIKAFQGLALGQDERYRAMERLATASRQRWDAYLRRQAETDAKVAARLRIPYRDLRRRALVQVARGLPPSLRGRLAERVGVPVRDLLLPPRIKLPPPKGAER